MDRTWSVARAECLEHHGAGEAYQPLLEALTRLCTQPQGESCLAALRHCAPTWLAQLPSLQTPAEHRARQRHADGATAERMLRELTDAFEMMTRRSSLVLCLEDLHWSDGATLDWIASFARRPETARMLVIGTYRPGEAQRRSHSPQSLADDLGLKGLCSEIALARLDAPAVAGLRHGALPASRWRRCGNRGAGDVGVSAHRRQSALHRQCAERPDGQGSARARRRSVESEHPTRRRLAGYSCGRPADH